MTLRTGIDLVELSRLEDLDPAVRERFLARVFTPRELQETQGQLHRLAGRFAAKEAAAKALGCGIGPVGWQEIEIRSGGQGEPSLALNGEAARLAAELGLHEWSVSITHSRTHAAAVVVGITSSGGAA